MTAKRGGAKGAQALLTRLGAALMFSIVAPPSVRADATPPFVGHLPVPGTYTLQRIQRVPEAQLLDADEKPAALSTATRGAITALAFFYGHCADPMGCPVAWATFEELQKAAAGDPLLQSRLRLVFVSIDPTHDTPAVMRLLQKSQNAARSPPWAFLTSRSQSDLAPLLASMGQEIAFEADASGRRTGVVNHILKVFLIDPQGWVREIYTTAFLTSDNLLNDARTLAMAHPEASNRREAQ